MAHRPTLGGSSGAVFPSQFPRALVSSISLSTTLIEHLSNDGQDTVVSHGSGSFWRNAGQVYLLTARHVVSGRDPFEDALMSTQGYIPRRFAVYPAVHNHLGHWQRTRYVFQFSEEGEQNWLQDPEFRVLRTDIASVPIRLSNVKLICCLNDEIDIFEEVFTHVGMECTIVGYPTTAFSGLMTPIWRRGNIASEPSLPIDRKPMFLLDAATSPGFSGSPVFRRHYGPLPVQQPDGSLNILSDRVMTTSFVGIYAGRLQNAHVGGEIPFVFYGNRLPFIFAQL